MSNLGDDADRDGDWDDDEPGSVDPVEDHQVMHLADFTSKRKWVAHHRRCTRTLHRFMRIHPLHRHLHPQRSGADMRKQRSTGRGGV